MQRFDSTKFYETTPFGKFGAIEPPLFVVSTSNGKHSSEGRFGGTKISERKQQVDSAKFTDGFSFRIAPNFPKGVVSEHWCYRTAAFSEKIYKISGT